MEELSNEAYFKARVSELLTSYGVSNQAIIKALKSDLFGLHEEVKERIDPTEELPFEKECVLPNFGIDKICFKCGKHISEHPFL